MRSPLPTEAWSCGGGEILNIRQWFAGVITPDFNTETARERLRSFDQEDVALYPNVDPHQQRRLSAATRTMKQTIEEINTNYKSFTASRSFASRLCSPLEPDSVRSASAALAATALGAGALALPYAFSLTGILLGLVTLTVAAMVSALSLQILMVAARYTDTKSYAAVLELSVGARWASFLLDLVVLLNGIGSVICILIFEGDFLPAVFEKPPLIEGMSVPRTWTIVGAVLCVWPLTVSANIGALRYVAIAVPCVLLLTIGIVVVDSKDFSALRSDRILWWDFDFRRWLQAVAIMVNAFANHMNAIPCVNSLAQPSVARIVKATVNGNLIVWALLSALGVGGYVSWGVVTQGDFLLNYPEGRPEIWFCRVLLSIIVFLVLPVALFPTAKSGAQLFISLFSKNTEVSPVVQAGASTTLLVVCCLVAIQVTDVAFVVGILGGLFASALMFGFPAIVFRNLLWPTMPKLFRCPSLFMICLFYGLGTMSVVIKFI